jgi:hypothetical protein
MFLPRRRDSSPGAPIPATLASLCPGNMQGPTIQRMLPLVD